jgi:DNA primase
MELKEFLDDLDIEYWTGGKNVTIGWINIQCPFCDDSSNHLGIRLSDLRVHCWKCGPKNLVRVVREITHKSYKEAKDIVKNIDASYHIPAESKKDRQKLLNYDNFVKIPEESTRHFPKMHREYLRKRGFKPLETIRIYKLRAVYNYGPYAFRIIIPIYKDGLIASFTSRDVSGYGEPKYKHAGPNESAIKAKHLLYGADEITKGGDAVLVEGIFDKWKLGRGSMATLGTMVSGQQMVQLAQMELRKLFIFFDNDRAGRTAARRLSRVVAPLAKQVEIIRLSGKGKDPGELTKEEAYMVMKGLRLRV